MPLGPEKVPILGRFWGPSWTLKSDMLAPRGEDVVSKVTFGGFPRELKKWIAKKNPGGVGPSSWSGQGSLGGPPSGAR